MIGCVPPGSPSSTSWRCEAVATAGAAALVMLFAASLVWCDPGYYWHDDYQLNYLPQFQEIARTLSHGHFPLVSPLSWQAGATGGEFQFGVFSLWMLACVAAVFALGLSLPATAAVLSIVHLGVLAGGAFRLARRRELPVPESLLTAVIAALNGWILVWGAMNWFVALAGLAWLPWAWWGLERAMAPRPNVGRTVTAGVFVYLLVTGGWHFGVLMLALVSVGLAVRSWWSGRRLRALWPLPLAWALGLGLSAPAWLMLLEYSQMTLRSHTPLWQLNWVWAAPVWSLPGLLSPAHTCSWWVFGHGWKTHSCIEMAGAFVPLVVIAAASARLKGVFWRQAGGDLALAGLALLLTIAPGVGNFRWSFRWLPLFFLAVALAAARGAALLRRRPGAIQQAPAAPGNVGVWAVILAASGLLAALLVSPDPTAFSRWYAFGVFLGCVAWVGLDRWGRAVRVRPWLPCLAALACLWAVYADCSRFLEVFTWDVRPDPVRSARLAPEVRYLTLFTTKDLYPPETRGTPNFFPGNCCMYEDRRFINGYSPLQLIGPTTLFGFETHGCVDRAAGERILRQEAGRGGLLDLFGVDGLVLSDEFASLVPALEARDWETTARWDGGRILRRRGAPSPQARTLDRVQWSSDSADAVRRLVERREGPAPLIVGAESPPQEAESSLGRADLRVVREDGGRVEIEVRNGDPNKPILATVARPLYLGCQATFNGKPVPGYLLDLTVPAVLLPPGAEGRLVLDYRPASLRIGLLACLGTVLFAAALLYLSRKRRSLFLTPSVGVRPTEAPTVAARA